jgi:signal transduction histidine kinase
MPDYNISEMTRIQRRIRLVENITIILVFGIVIVLKWVSSLLIPYVAVIVALLIYRKHLNKKLERQRALAKAVEERTRELRTERDQVRRESEKLSAALAALNEAQDELVRNERFTTAGQLTKGLVDRILNPLNYINNFAGLSKNLLADLDKEMDEADKACPQVTKEMREIAGMLSANLDKIMEHGGNTVRIVKAMEELLKEQKGKMAAADINSLCKVNLDVVRKLYAASIERYGIRIRFNRMNLSLMIDINIELMSKVLLSFFKNALYALAQKAAKGQEGFQPELSVSLEKRGDFIAILIRDNGNGIDGSLHERIFEPFFTTKPTGEAAGIGLYLSREVVLNHHGNIKLESKPGEFTEFTITLPIHQYKGNNNDGTETE